MRIDKWLWAVRLFKTRSLASEACKSGKVKIDGRSVKPSYILKGAEEITVQKGPEKKVVRVIDLLEKRVNAVTASQYYEDITPVTDAPGMPSAFHAPVFKRNRGAGRPTKKERREIDQLRSKTG
ncbi:MAG: RNA-binding S4 domain-containing protein [Solitalea sp.]